jgi:hypothetical protein
MVIALYSYHTRPSPGKTPLALYQEWQCILNNLNVLSTEMFIGAQDPAEMIMLARFADEESAWAAADSTEHRSWYAQLAQISEDGPAVCHYREVR